MKTMLFNPYSGLPRHPSDIASDPKGILMPDPDEPLRPYVAPVDKDTAAIIEIDRVMLEASAHWPDLETDAMVVRHIKQFTRMLNAERAEVQALREQARLAYMSGVDNFRRLYDAELFKVISVTGFRDLYAPAGSVPAPEAAVEPSMTVAFDEGAKEPRIVSWNQHPTGTYWLYSTPQP